MSELNRANLRTLGEIGGLNKIGGIGLHRRDALWQVEKVSQKVGPLLEGINERDLFSHLAQMDTEERIVADLSRDRPDHWATPDVLQTCRATPGEDQLRGGVEETAKWCESDFSRCRHYPPETWYCKRFSVPDPGRLRLGIPTSSPCRTSMKKNRRAILKPRFVRVGGTVQNQDGIVHLRAEYIAPLLVSKAQVSSHDFH